mgnify:CR=1 FL=1
MNSTSALSRPEAPRVAVSLEIQNLALQRKNRILCQQLRNLSARNRLLEQLNLALGDHHRSLASEEIGHSASDNETFDHFVFNGGKKHYDETHSRKG